MEVSNASHYDGATALAEAAILALNHHRGKRSRLVLSPAIHPHYRQVARTYMQGMGVEIAGDEHLPSSADDLPSQIDGKHGHGRRAVSGFLRPDSRLDCVRQGRARRRRVALRGGQPARAGLAPPAVRVRRRYRRRATDSRWDPDVVRRTTLGHFTIKQEFVRKMAGRLVGETVDSRGQRGYVLTLTPREQHIRREKATSNICTNVALMALASAVYLSLLGKTGSAPGGGALLPQGALRRRPAGCGARLFPVDQRSFFHEFVLKCPRPVAEINQALLDFDILGGYDLGQDYPELSDHMLLAFTEMNSRDQIDALAEALEGGVHA